MGAWLGQGKRPPPTLCAVSCGAGAWEGGGGLLCTNSVRAHGRESRGGSGQQQVQQQAGHDLSRAQPELERVGWRIVATAEGAFLLHLLEEFASLRLAPRCLRCSYKFAVRVPSWHSASIARLSRGPNSPQRIQHRHVLLVQEGVHLPQPKGMQGLREEEKAVSTPATAKERQQQQRRGGGVDAALQPGEVQRTSTSFPTWNRWPSTPGLAPFQ